ncbi:cupin domain-containing protein [Pararhodospirillum oryzae]|uniref:Cupin type-2 domain-containing protein n=1 Tax=Pararhodospirillum oryzae TaxID=478448 RepID=A0A512HAT3_9PROT|nr:cupin domain-containing protein [Pararhodospirillum oryzae]GEO82552.1 hypothetical protein ROR02_26830 [Pararhodospirillum oryzae]
MSAPLPSLFDPLAGDPGQERLETLARVDAGPVRIERIVSTGQASPPDFWYDQPWTEWVMVVSGHAVLRFADEPAPRPLGPGTWALIAPHRRHRVEATAPDQPTVWLAVHVGEPDGETGSA